MSRKKERKKESDLLSVIQQYEMKYRVNDGQIKCIRKKEKLRECVNLMLNITAGYITYSYFHANSTSTVNCDVKIKI